MYSFTVLFFVRCVGQQLHKVRYIENRDDMLLLEHKPDCISKPELRSIARPCYAVLERPDRVLVVSPVGDLLRYFT